MIARDGWDDRMEAERWANAYTELLAGLSPELNNSALAEHLRKRLRLWRMRGGLESSTRLRIPVHLRLV